MNSYNDSNWTGRTARTLSDTRLGAHASFHESRPQSRTVFNVVSILGALAGAAALIALVGAVFWA